MWANWVWQPVLPQLTLWPESHIISTHFSDHDMANMRSLKTPRALLPAKNASVTALCKQASRFDSHSVPIHCHYLKGAVFLKGYENALTTHEISTSVPRTLCHWREKEQVIIKAHCGGRTFLFPHSPVWLALYI